MRIAVTGAAGFLGSSVCTRLAGSGHQVLGMDRAGSHLPAGCEASACDISDHDAVRDALQAFAPQAVIHLAALLTLESGSDIVAATRVNALGTAHIFAEALAAGASRIIYASSVAALGGADTSFGDRSVPQPGSVYGATKAYGEHLANCVAPNHPDTTFIGLRYGYVYGPGRARGWREMQEMVEAAHRGDTEIVFPDYPDPVDWTWVEDATDVTVRMLDAEIAGSRVFNVVGDKRRMRDAAQLLAARYPAARLIPKAAVTPPSAWGFWNDGLKSAIGIEPKTTMEQGIDLCLRFLDDGLLASPASTPATAADRHKDGPGPSF
ncbi:NAD(P)-dependent oxidoreductase [Sinorhizobium sp. BG8]|uniref:NAD-dependent epimerase/dehydratase family protein n=1 Tax=Sinorhizobium sp. BG8 TaxID=2613773 RepID=UPI00193D641A|nr:NAD(P)-dependent oxidoreductase [Sinorhizobium sp. BG8]QRM53251.1 NAD(P)-dependent oxidoreductase [Sinorhizobium sp. BG8]